MLSGVAKSRGQSLEIHDCTYVGDNEDRTTHFLVWVVFDIGQIHLSNPPASSTPERDLGVAPQ